MNKTFGNILMIVFGFLAHFFLAKSQNWDLIAAIGGMVAGVGISNLSFYVFPNQRNKLDWIIPAGMLVIFGSLIYFLRSINYFGLEGFNLQLAQTTMLIITIAPLARFYIYLMRYLDLLKATKN